MDKISVIVPVYNIEQYIGECLESLACQTYENYEVLVINDGSPDHSEEVIKPFLRDKRFRYLKKKNGGLSSARNFGMDHATGEYLAFVDGDDYVEPNYLEELYHTIKENHVDIAVCSFERNYPKKISYNPIGLSEVLSFRCPAAWNKLYKKSLLDQYEIRFPEGLWYEDLHFTTRAIMVGSVAVTEKYLYHYRQTSTSIMHTYDDRIFQIYQVISEIHEFAKQNDVYEIHYDSLLFATVYHVLIGTTYRASFHKDFSVSMVEENANFVAKMYPEWYNNNSMKDNLSGNLSLAFQIFLFLMHHHSYRLIALLFKMFHRFVNL